MEWILLGVIAVGYLGFLAVSYMQGKIALKELREEQRFLRTMEKIDRIPKTSVEDLEEKWSV